MTHLRCLSAWLLVGAVALGCAVDSRGDVATEEPLRTDPNAVVFTNDPGARVLGGYNALLDRSVSSACVAPAGTPSADVGDVRSAFYLRHVSTKEELAKELDVDVGVSLKLPRGSGDASLKLVKSMTRTATTVNFLVRAVRSYGVTNRGNVVLTPSARAVLATHRTSDFLTRCGGSYVSSVRYEAQVIGLLRFESASEESARRIETALGAAGPAGALGGASIKTTSEEIARNNAASLSITVVATGFAPPSTASADAVEHTFEKFDELRAQMDTSLEADLRLDREGYFTNTRRNARPTVLTQASYSQVGDAASAAPPADYARITTTLQRAEEFFRAVAGTQLRLEAAYTDEVERFLNDSAEQYRYNVVTAPKLRTEDLVPIAQQWAARFRPEGAHSPGTLVLPLRMHLERCLTAAGNGNYSACETDQVIDGERAAAEAALEEYVRAGRIVPTSVVRPKTESVSYRNASGVCVAAGLRLPNRAEMGLIAPAVTALAGPAGEVWFGGDATCEKPLFTNNVGQGAYGCDTSVSEGMPYVADRPVLCVPNSGPVGALSPP